MGQGFEPNTPAGDRNIQKQG